jgi:hypothetical protein
MRICATSRANAKSGQYIRQGVTGWEVANDRQVAAKPTAELFYTWLNTVQSRRAPITSIAMHHLQLLKNFYLKHIHPHNVFSQGRKVC